MLAFLFAILPACLLACVLACLRRIKCKELKWIKFKEFLHRNIGRSELITGKEGKKSDCKHDDEAVELGNLST